MCVKELFSARFLEFFSSWVSLTRFGVYNIYRVWCVLPMPKPGLRRGAGAGPAQLVRGARQIDNFLKEKIIVGGAGGSYGGNAHGPVLKGNCSNPEFAQSGSRNGIPYQMYSVYIGKRGHLERCKTVDSVNIRFLVRNGPPD